MRVWIYSDEFATMSTTQDEEYADIKRRFQDMADDVLPGTKVVFEEGKRPSDLANGSADVYIFDIGGMCYADHSGALRLSWCNEVLRQAQDRPNTLFIPWSSMTGDYLRTAILQLLPEWDDEDATLPEAHPPANVWLPKEGERFEWYKMPGLADKLKLWGAK